MQLSSAMIGSGRLVDRRGDAPSQSSAGNGCSMNSTPSVGQFVRVRDRLVGRPAAVGVDAEHGVGVLPQLADDVEVVGRAELDFVDRPAGIPPTASPPSISTVSMPMVKFDCRDAVGRKSPKLIAPVHPAVFPHRSWAASSTVHKANKEGGSRIEDRKSAALAWLLAPGSGSPRQPTAAQDPTTMSSGQRASRIPDTPAPIPGAAVIDSRSHRST